MGSAPQGPHQLIFFGYHANPLLDACIHSKQQVYIRGRQDSDPNRNFNLEIKIESHKVLILIPNFRIRIVDFGPKNQILIF